MLARRAGAAVARRGAMQASPTAWAGLRPVVMAPGATAPQKRAMSGDAHRIEAQHVESTRNRDSTPFDFTLENMKEVEKILSHYPEMYKKGATIPLLDLAQRQNGGWLPLAAMNKVAKIVGCPNIQVYETAAFYTMFNRQPIGKHHVQVCTTTPCMLRGAYEVLEACKTRLGVDIGETTADGQFTLGEVECAGACVNAPCMAVGDDYYEDLEPKDAVRILDAFAKGETPKAGPQNGRTNCEGVEGYTSLFEEPASSYWRKELDE
jgi:NADH dehydrogenase (ubiquinone) flavoprotein 2